MKIITESPTECSKINIMVLNHLKLEVQASEQKCQEEKKMMNWVIHCLSFCHCQINLRFGGLNGRHVFAGELCIR